MITKKQLRREVEVLKGAIMMKTDNEYKAYGQNRKMQHTINELLIAIGYSDDPILKKIANNIMQDIWSE